MSLMDEKSLINLQILTNSYATKKVNEALDELEAALSGTNKNIVYTRKLTDKVLGKWIALAYAQGYRDCYEKIEPKRNIFM